MSRPFALRKSGAEAAAVQTLRVPGCEFGKDGMNGAMLLDLHDPEELENFVDDPKCKSVAELSALTRKYAATLGS